MSIATDEAEKKYPRDVALTAASINNVCRRSGYIAGRTAEPTTLEVEDAGYALWKTDVNMADLNPTESEYADAWEKLSKQQRDMYRSKARTVLEVARKAVTE